MDFPQNDNDKQSYYAAESIKDNQILQRCARNEQATVLFEDGSLRAYNVGGPYRIHKARNVYVGDIWIMAGQSNMRGHGYQIDPYTNCTLIEQGQLGTHLYDSKEEWTRAKEPLHQLYLSPRTVHHTLPDPTVKNPKLLEYRGASLGLSFAKEYREKLSNVPVGLVASAHGGTSLNDWKRPDTLDEDSEDKTLYGAMMARIKAVGGRIAGILWYQGESDTTVAEDALTYRDRFRLWMDTLRQDLRDPTLPIAFVQIGPHAIDVGEMRKNWKLVQLAQFELMMEQGYSAGVASIDCSLDDRLHLSAAGLKVVGKRLAIAAENLLMAARSGVGLHKDTFCAQYQDPVIPDLNGKIPPCILLTTTWPTEPLVEGSDVLGFGLCCQDKSVAIIHARVSEIRNHFNISISHMPKTELFLTYGLTYPLIDSSNKGWPAFCIKVNF
ncbi:SGNH hydrolase-type esterase domain-containing protein [Mucor lusitanicus]|uniref:SGNH hydrolase-type esterase domain-containing protein n=1 Tax=Mucor circinelloides f. lusitanicus TaxID=29924 RepID=A0A8H4BA70_MUCCL|nr:SGNH hydrolase-type esterase domain-containing protein [Mucor lusitanicus]